MSPGAGVVWITDAGAGFGVLDQQTFSASSAENRALGLQSELYNRSTHCGFYMPKIKITGISSGLAGRSVSIKNLSEVGRETLLSDIPIGVTEIVLDQQRGVITNNTGENLYDKFNFQFCRLIRGNNILQFSGRFTAEFICEFPLNMGV